MGKNYENGKDKKEKPQYNAWQNSWFMIKLAWQSEEKKVLVLCVLTAVFAVLKNLLELYIVPSVLSVVERKASVEEMILTILAFVGGLMFVAAGAAYVEESIMYGRITVRSVLLSLIHKKTTTTSYPNLYDDKFDKLLSKSLKTVSSNHDAGEEIWHTLEELLKNILGFAIYLSLLASVHALLMGVVLITAVIGHIVNKYTNEYGYTHRDEEAEAIRKLRYVRDKSQEYSAAKDVRIFGLRSWLEELYEKALDTYTDFHKKVQGVYLWAKIADVVLAFLRSGIAYTYLIYLLLKQNLSVAQFLLYFSAVSGFAAWILGILDNLNTLQKHSLDLNNVREYLEYAEPFTFETGEKLEAEAGKSYEIRFDKVSFRYPGTEKYILKDVNLTLHSGEKLAVVGLNGAGKTTLVKLMCGFLDPTSGCVLLNDRDVRDYNREDYYEIFTALFQDFEVLPGTIANNIAQTWEDIDMELVKKCAEKAGLGEKIHSLPAQYDTFLNRSVYEEAVMLSGGETQRLMLARALYKNAPIVVLDEPTAALDPIAEYDMYQKYSQMTQGKSSVYISHRLASTRFCDRIILLENSMIAEEGTHESLMQKGSKYAELFAVQSKYYREGESGHEE